ncbi:MAG TPA: acylphosphatase [Burkholderiales bacterium]|nr:acylphosphatase [Burkholderiales bacterium]
MKTRQIRVQGRVQGVGFRYALRDEAQRLGLSGWVRNCTDGSVEALLQGEARAVEALVHWARRGPRAARVETLVEAEPQAQFDRPYLSFEIWPTA